MELSREISRQQALHIYVTQRLKNLKKDLFVDLSDEEIENIATKSCEKLLKVREKELDNGLVKDSKLRLRLNKLTLDWLLVDKDQDLHLEDSEIEQLINNELGVK